ncbi:MAG: glycosyl hydrolase family 18 protein [Saprospiraceae bacterium]|nr:glycosyl hydrolase family 18 protein [Saprospiraceae bacterium]
MKNLILLGLSCLVIVTACNEKIAVSKQEASAFRVLGYLPSSRDWGAGLDAVDFAKITDLNLAFINPDSTGHFADNEMYYKIIQKAHDHRVRVFLSIGGGSPPAHLEHLMKPEKRGKLVTGLVDIAGKYGFDGIDVDIENDLINADYPPLVSELGKALKSKNIMMTAALASWNSHLIHDSTLYSYDFINIMSYDRTGPWNLNRPGQHSPFSMVQNDFKYFNQTRRVPAEKLFIGLPFYGYGFGSGVPQSLPYKSIISTYPGSEQTDSVSVAQGGTMYYNGMPTIQQKIRFAIDNKAGGVMIWQLLGDSRDDKSLLKVIEDVRKGQ